MKSKMDAILQGVSTVAIAGHQRPDGDCVGSCMGMYLYLERKLSYHSGGRISGRGGGRLFSYSKSGSGKKCMAGRSDIRFLLLFDVSSVDRIGVAGKALETAKHSFCVDHHITNRGLLKKIMWFLRQVLLARCCTSFWMRRRSQRGSQRALYPGYP